MTNKHPAWRGAAAHMNSPAESPENPFKFLAEATRGLADDFIKDLPLRNLDLQALLRGLLSSPETRNKLIELQNRYYQNWLALWRSPAGAGPAGDRRFEEPEWRELPWFRTLHQVYVLNSEYLKAVAELAHLPPESKHRLVFFTQQLLDALAPTNYPATNPVAIRCALKTGGETLARGAKLLAGDLARRRISMTDETAFEVGRNLAVTPGEVVFENELVQLIQYRASSPQVYQRPLLIVPPFINKYYILDLQPENSFVRYCVEQGFTTFMVSWRNIPEELGHLTWEDYLDKGVLASVEVARKISSSDTINALGFCVGGTLLATAVAVLAAKHKKSVHSLTLLASMLDFSDPGEITVYIDRDYVERCEQEYRERGVVPGSRLADTFATLRANDLVWHFVVNNYLLGRPPRPFDLLYWNADGSNLPGPLYAFYLRNTYLENNLRVPGKLKLKGVGIDFGRIKLPSFIVATHEDHIVPWKTAYESALLLGGKTEFVLGASGHVAGIVNPVTLNRRGYWVGSSGLKPTADDWMASAHEKTGSWWSYWREWLSTRSGGLVPAPAGIGGSGYEPIEPAPGRYVLERHDRAPGAAETKQHN